MPLVNTNYLNSSTPNYIYGVIQGHPKNITG